MQNKYTVWPGASEHWWRSQATSEEEIDALLRLLFIEATTTFYREIEKRRDFYPVLPDRVDAQP